MWNMKAETKNKWGENMVFMEKEDNFKLQLLTNVLREIKERHYTHIRRMGCY